MVQNEYLTSNYPKAQLTTKALLGGYKPQENGHQMPITIHYSAHNMAYLLVAGKAILAACLTKAEAEALQADLQGRILL